MSDDLKKHWIVEHIWRAIRAMFLLGGTAVWLYTDHVHLVFLLLLGAAVVDQLHGLICRNIQRVLHWHEDFNYWE